MLKYNRQYLYCVEEQETIKLIWNFMFARDHEIFIIIIVWAERGGNTSVVINSVLITRQA